jgi:hypothetical protein
MKINKKILYNLYREQNISLQKIAKIFKCSYSKIYRLMVKYNIKKKREGRYIKYYFNKKQLEKLYLKQKLSITKIAWKLKCGYSTICNCLKRFNILSRSRGEWKINKSINLSQKELEIIYGELLGDGCLFLPKKIKNAKFQHCSIHKNYETYLKNKLNFLKKCKIYKYKHKGKAASYHITSLTSPTFTKLYNQWYLNRIKHVLINIKLTPIIIKHWYLGDGHLCKKNKIITLCTHCFLKKEQKKILLPQLNKLGFEAKLYKRKQKNGKIQWYIRIPHRNVYKFIKYIGPCPIKCFKYKWKI